MINGLEKDLREAQVTPGKETGEFALNSVLTQPSTFTVNGSSTASARSPKSSIPQNTGAMSPQEKPLKDNGQSSALGTNYYDGHMKNRKNPFAAGPPSVKSQDLRLYEKGFSTGDVDNTATLPVSRNVYSERNAFEFASMGKEDNSVAMMGTKRPGVNVTGSPHHRIPQPLQSTSSAGEVHWRPGYGPTMRADVPEYLQVYPPSMLMTRSQADRAGAQTVSIGR